MATQHFLTQSVDGVEIIQLIHSRIEETIPISEMEDELLQFIDARKPDKIIVDFSSVTRFSTAVINGLLRAKKRLIAYGAKLRLCGMRPPIRKVFRELNLDGTVFHIDEDVTESMGKI